VRWIRTSAVVVPVLLLAACTADVRVDAVGEGPVRTTEAFCAAEAEGDFAASYEQLSEPTRRTVDLQAWTQQRSAAAASGRARTSCRIGGPEREDTAALSDVVRLPVEIGFRDGATAGLRLRLLNGDRGWRVDLEDEH